MRGVCTIRRREGTRCGSDVAGVVVVFGYGVRVEGLSVRGTQVAAIFYTLIETCILCGVDPEEYMRFTARAARLKPGTAILPQEFARERGLAGEAPATCAVYLSALRTNT